MMDLYVLGIYELSSYLMICQLIDESMMKVPCVLRTPMEW